MRPDIVEVLLEDEPGFGNHIVGDRFETLFQLRRVAGYPLAHSGDARAELDAHGTAIQQTVSGADCVVARERAVTRQHRFGHAPREFPGPPRG